MKPQIGEITLLLERWRVGDSAAFETLMPLVYPHLREVATAYLRRERSPDVMQATSLVHDLYLRLLSQKQADWKDRIHFYTFCSKMMRLILIDQARVSHAQRRGAHAVHIPLSDDLPWVNLGSPELLDLDIALNALADTDAALAQMVELRFFLGCTTEETAEIMGVSETTVKRGLKFAKTWLFRRIAPDVKRIESRA